MGVSGGIRERFLCMSERLVEGDRKKAEKIEAKRRKAVERFLCVEIVVQKDKTMPSEPVTSENRYAPLPF